MTGRARDGAARWVPAPPCRRGPTGRSGHNGRVPPRPLARLLRVGATVTVSAALLVACASMPGSGSAAESPEPTATVGGLMPEVTAATLPEQQLDAGTVATGAPVTLFGEGPAVVDFVRGGDFGVVARLDCSTCSGRVQVRDPVEQSVWGSGEAPLTGSYLVDLHADAEAERSVVLDAEGPWSVELVSWEDLPVVTGPQQGTGATVLRLGDEARGVQLGFTPAGPDDELVGRAVQDSDLASPDAAGVLSFGSESAVEQAPVQLALPGLVALSTAGSWTLTPVG